MSSNIDKEAQEPVRAPPRRQSTPKDSRPLTPTSPAVSSNLFQRDNRQAATPGRAAPVQSFDASSTSATPGIGTMQTSPIRRADSHQPLPTNPPPALILEKADGSFDDENPLPSAHFRNSNVIEFFSFVSEITKKSRDSFDRLTFTFLFASGDDRTWLIQEGDEIAWNKLKKKARFLCNLWRTRLEESELQLVVEFGDKRNMIIW